MHGILHVRSVWSVVMPCILQVEQVMEGILQLEQVMQGILPEGQVRHTGCATLNLNFLALNFQKYAGSAVMYPFSKIPQNATVYHSNLL